MIPVRLTFQGLYSYQNEQVIDFERLTAAGLFGIFGPVGSGKSTILEAISFALFDRIDRLKGDRRNYNMMNLKSDRLFIDFEFLANDGNRYRIEVTGRRNRKNFTEVPTFKRSLYSLTGDIWIPMEETTAEAITGLGYDNFHRTIIIPQGRFQEFLQLSVKERVTMLKDLFSLNKYDLFDKTVLLESENNRQLQNLAGQITQLGEIKPGDIDSLEQQIAENQKSIDSITAELEKDRKRDRELEDLRRLSEEVKKQKEKVSALLAEEPAYIALEKEVMEYEILYMAFHSELEQLKALKQSLAKQSLDIETKKTEYRKLSDEMISGRDEFNRLKPSYDRREDFLKEAEEFNKLAQVVKLEKVIRKATAETLKEKEQLILLASAIKAAKEALADSAGKLAFLRNKLPDIRTLSEIKNWFREKQSIAGQIFTENQILDALKEKTNEKSDEAYRLAGSLISISGYPEKPDLSGCLSQVEVKRVEVENDLKDLGPQISELEIQKRLEEFSEELHEGKPCPLCGSEEHPHILDVHDVSHKLGLILRQKEELESEIKRFLKGEKELNSHMKEISLNHNQLINHYGNLEELASKQASHRKKFIWERFSPDDEQPVDEEIKLFDSISRDIREIESGIENINKSVSGNELKYESIAFKIRSDENEITGYTAESNLLSGQLSIIKKSDWASHPPDLLEAKSESLKKEYLAVTNNYRLAEERLKTQQSRIDTLSGVIETETKQIEILTRQTEGLAEKINAKLIQHGGVALDHVEMVVNKQLDLEKTRQKINLFRTALEAARAHLLKLGNDLSDREYPPDEHRKVKEQLKSFQTRIDFMNQQMGNLKTSLSALEKNLIELEKLKTEQGALVLRANNLCTLRNLFRGSAFVNFASRAYLTNIVMAANIRFRKLTRQHLELVLDEDNNFMIRDHMNEGKVRSVKTLSGGQIFQASLSLALALADNVNRQVEADQNFFFLDEGFGSLDRESLGVVFETLKALRKENRIVGVISHVEEMQQEIDSHLLVSIDEEHGSRIICSLY